ncbi:MAG TPA: DUF350 domain-containing protein [Rectinemataceae bacterium]|nr:DUF350 domain-containing protein [Rectinemataceae bacterium]
MDALILAATAALSLFPYFLLALALFLLGKYFFDWTTPRIDDNKELTVRDNPAFGVLLAGYLLGLGLALGASLLQLSPSPWQNLRDIATSGIASIVLLRLSLLIGDALILRPFGINDEIVRDRNLGVGLAFGGLMTAGGLVTAGVMSGSSSGYLTMLRDIGVYWLLGQAFLLAAWLLFRLVSRIDLGSELGERDNPAAGLSLAGFFIAAGIVLRAALTGAGSQLGSELLVSLALAVLGLLVLGLARGLVSLVLLPRSNVADEIGAQKNTAAAVVTAVGSIAVALLYAALVGSQVG